MTAIAHYDYTAFLANLDKRDVLTQRYNELRHEADSYLRTYGRFDDETEGTLLRLSRQIQELTNEINKETGG